MRTGVKDVGSSSLLVIQVHGSKIATSKERGRTEKSLLINGEMSTLFAIS
jgi:hypothetical protein